LNLAAAEQAVARELAPTPRRYDVDWLRTIALGLLIIYHIVLTFQPWAESIYFFQNDTLLEPVWLPMELINVWRIPLLFLVSGMGMRFAMERRNMGQLCIDRLVRIGVPGIFGYFAIGPIMWFFLASHRGLEPTYEPAMWHLWFLINILCYASMFLYLSYYFATEPDNPFIRFVSRVLDRPWLLYLAAVPYMLEAWLVNPEYFAIYTEGHGWVLGIVLFGLGVLLASLKDAFWTAAERIRWLSLGIAFTLFCVRLAEPDLGQLANPLTAFESTCWILALLGIAARHLNKPSSTLTYLTRSVFPVYILHFPAQYAISYYLIPTDLSAELKLAILLVGTFAVCFFLYEIIRRIKPLRPLFGMKWRL